MPELHNEKLRLLRVAGLAGGFFLVGLAILIFDIVRGNGLAFPRGMMVSAGLIAVIVFFAGLPARRR